MRNEREWNGTCHRCGKRTTIHTMSRFNTDLICMGCDAAERKHPDYDQACRVEADAVRHGDYNFPGIGWPREPKDPPVSNIFKGPEA